MQTQRHIQSFISERETEVLKAILNGQTASEIANRFFLSRHTVISHRNNLKQKLGAKNIAHLIRIAFEEKILH